MLCFLEHAYNGGAVMAVMDLERHRNGSHHPSLGPPG